MVTTKRKGHREMSANGGGPTKSSLSLTSILWPLRIMEYYKQGVTGHIYTPSCFMWNDSQKTEDEK